MTGSCSSSSSGSRRACVRARLDEPVLVYRTTGIVELCARRLCGDRRTVHVPAQRHVARARDAVSVPLAVPVVAPRRGRRRLSATGRRISRARSSPSAPPFWRAAPAQVRRHPAQLSGHLRPSVEHRGRPRLASSTCSSRRRRAPVRRRIDALPPPDDQSTSSSLWLDSRRAAELVGLNTSVRSASSRLPARRLLRARRRVARAERPDDVQLDVQITVNGFAAAVFGGLGFNPPRAARRLRSGSSSSLWSATPVPQYSLTIALIVMLVLIGWRLRRRSRATSHARRNAAIQRARVPWPAPVRFADPRRALFACWLPYQLGTFDVALYDRMGLYALVDDAPTLPMGYAGQISLGQEPLFLIGAYTSAILTVGIDPDTRLVDLGAGVSPVLAVLAAPVVAAVLMAVIGVPLLRLHGHYPRSRHSHSTSSRSRFSLHGTGSRGGQYGTGDKLLIMFGHDLRGPLHAAVVRGVVAVALSATNLVHSRVGRVAGDRHRRGVGGRVGHPGRELQAAAVRLRAASPGSAEGRSPSRSSSSRPRRSPSCSASSSSSWSRCRRPRQHLRRGRGGRRHPSTSSRSPRPGNAADLFGWDPPTRLRRCSRSASSG